MDTFAAITFGALLLVFLAFLAIGYLWRREPVEEITDRHRNERWAAQIQVEERDVPEMLEAANEYRRNRGMPEITPEEFGARVEREQHELLRQAEKQLRARGSR